MEIYYEKTWKNAFAVMTALAVWGPASKWDLAGKHAGKEKEGRTSLSWAVVHRLMGKLLNLGWVEERGRVKGKKHETTLYGLTELGLLNLSHAPQRCIDEMYEHLDLMRENTPEALRWVDLDYKYERARLVEDLKEGKRPLGEHLAIVEVLKEAKKMEFDPLLDDVLKPPISARLAWSRITPGVEDYRKAVRFFEKYPVFHGALLKRLEITISDYKRRIEKCEMFYDVLSKRSHHQGRPSRAGAERSREETAESRDPPKGHVAKAEAP